MSMAMPVTELVLAYELRCEGCSWQRIASGLGYDPLVISKAVHKAKTHGLRKGLNGYTRQPGRPSTFPLSIVRRAHAMRLRGSSWRGVARELLDDDSRAKAERLRTACSMAKHYLHEEYVQ